MKTLRKIFCILFFLTLTLAVVATGYYFFTTKDTIGTGVVQGLKILYTHGHLYEVKKGMFKLSRKAMDENASIVLFGHTHERFCAEQDGILYFNPGSISVPRGCKIPTYGEIIIEDGKIISYRHVELT